jgi:hypothetical protein
MNENTTTTTATDVMFPQAYYDAAGKVNDIKAALNTSFGDYSTYFFTTDTEEAKDSIETLRRLINLREFQVEQARQALKAYEYEVSVNGPRAYYEFQRQMIEIRKADQA